MRGRRRRRSYETMTVSTCAVAEGRGVSPYNPVTVERPLIGTIRELSNIDAKSDFSAFCMRATI